MIARAWNGNEVCVNRYAVTAREGGTLQSVLRREMPLMPARILREAFGRRDVRVNGERAGRDATVSPGDEIVLYTPYAPPGIPVVYEDERCIVVNKPVGVNTDENDRSGFSLLSWARERAAGQYEPELAHRLDNQTSGLVILAKDPQSGNMLRQAFKDRTVIKVYAAIVVGTPAPAEGIFTAWLVKDAKTARVAVSANKTSGSQRIVTEYEVLEPMDGMSLLRVALHTGRTHQIRAHMAFLGHPVVGDETYGDWEVNRKHGAGLRLCAAYLAFPGNSAASWLGMKAFTVNPPFAPRWHEYFDNNTKEKPDGT